MALISSSFWNLEIYFKWKKKKNPSDMIQFLLLPRELAIVFSPRALRKINEGQFSGSLSVIA